MNSISERELTDFIKNNAVKKLNIVQNKIDKFQINITLTWKLGTWHLVTTRGKVRQWASLDRLSSHIREEYGNELPPISLTLNKRNGEKK